jgi:uncharacterized membrane protein YjdF
VPSRVPLICLIVFAVVWTALAVSPRFREDWLLENLLTFVAVPAALWSWRRFRFSDRAYVQATIFLILHTVGSHYTYSEVPLGNWRARRSASRATTTTASCTSPSGSSCCGRCASWGSGGDARAPSPS